MERPRFTIGTWIAAAGLTALASAAATQTFPNRSLTIIDPYPPGGSTTVLIRVRGDKMAETLGQPVVMENRAGGAGGTIGTRAVARSAPDGHTLSLGFTVPLVLAPLMYQNAGYDTLKDFTPMGLVGKASLVLVVHPSVPA